MVQHYIVLQEEVPKADQVRQAGENQTDVIILTHDTREGTMNDVLAQMQALPTVMAPITKIRKEELNWCATCPPGVILIAKGFAKFC